jgi:hypothetical protein
MRFLLHERADEEIAIDLKAALCIGAIPGDAAGTIITTQFQCRGNQILSEMFRKLLSADYEPFILPYDMLTPS